MEFYIKNIEFKLISFQHDTRAKNENIHLNNKLISSNGDGIHNQLRLYSHTLASRLASIENIS